MRRTVKDDIDTADQLSRDDYFDSIPDISNRPVSDEVILNDLLESISDYASTYLSNGYVLLENYFVKDDSIHCYYDYYSYTDDSESTDGIDFIIDISSYAVNNISYLSKYIDELSYKVAHEFLITDSIN